MSLGEHVEFEISCHWAMYHITRVKYWLDVRTTNEPYLPERRQALMVCKVTLCTGHVLTNALG